jgi:hypothetical protein
VYHYYDPNAGGVFYGDYFNGSIAAVKVWSGALDDAGVLASFRSDSATYLPSDPEPALKQLVSFRADNSNGAGRYPIPGNAGPWVDLSGNGHSATLLAFAGTDSTGGWAGQNGLCRLAFDGARTRGDPGRQYPEMRSRRRRAALVQDRPPRRSDTARSLVQWLAGITVSGMSLESAASASTVRVWVPA